MRRICFRPRSQFSAAVAVDSRFWSPLLPRRHRPPKAPMPPNISPSQPLRLVRRTCAVRLVRALGRTRTPAAARGNGETEKTGSPAGCFARLGLVDDALSRGTMYAHVRIPHSGPLHAVSLLHPPQGVRLLCAEKNARAGLDCPCLAPPTPELAKQYY